MWRTALPFLLMVTALGAPRPVPQLLVDLEKDRAELLRMHRTDREAHFKTDADLLFSNTADDFISVSQGRVNRPTVAALRSRFGENFKGATYAEWDDLEPPVIRISDDGTMAWMITRLRVTRTVRSDGGAGKKEQFTYAGITTYSKRDGRWQKSANVSTFE